MKKRKKGKKENEINNISAQPVDAFDMVNKYGTYEIQPTSDSENAFPKIAQGLPKEAKNQ